MAFTDREMIRFRAICERADEEGGLFVNGPDRVLALLERLEAAEYLWEYAKYYTPVSEEDEEVYNLHVEKWRVSRGV